MRIAVYFPADARKVETFVETYAQGLLDTPYPSFVEALPRAVRAPILDAVSADHDINAYLNLLGLDGSLTLVGAPAKPLAAPPSQSNSAHPCKCSRPPVAKSTNSRPVLGFAAMLPSVLNMLLPQ